jgi:hypothetical protein
MLTWLLVSLLTRLTPSFMIAKIKLSYSHKYTVEDLELINNAMFNRYGNVAPMLTIDDDGDLCWVAYSGFCVDLKLMPRSLPFDVVELYRYDDDTGTTNVPQYNHLVGTVVCGNELSRIKELKAIEDACSDLITQHLRVGWCIVSVMPQPDQRRPDYILGK